MQPDRFEWPNRVRWFDIAWVLFSLANLYAMLLWPEWETVPFHFIWVSLTILYGFRVWKARPTTVILAFVMVLTGTLIWIDVSQGRHLARRAHRGPPHGGHVRGDGVACAPAPDGHGGDRACVAGEPASARTRAAVRARRLARAADADHRRPGACGADPTDREGPYPRRGCRRHRRRADAPASPRQPPPPARRSGGPRVPPPGAGRRGDDRGRRCPPLDRDAAALASRKHRGGDGDGRRRPPRSRARRPDRERGEPHSGARTRSRWRSAAVAPGP